jgi:acetylornithine aminotransferase/acetylornithine/N-succinyldiaminopimelate aminotransferase
METIQGEGGIYPVSETFWKRARELATQHDAALIADEIQCGLGRTGRAFAYQKLSGAPDIVVIAKPLAAGVPLGAMLSNESFASVLAPGMHGTTFGGGPLACAVALEFLNVMEDEKLLANVRERGAELRQGLLALANKYDFIKEIRGEGLMVGVQLSVEGAPFVAEALANRVLINCTHETTLRLLPPYIVKSKDVREFIKRMDVVFSKVSKANSKSADSPRAQKSEPAHDARTLAASR